MGVQVVRYFTWQHWNPFSRYLTAYKRASSSSFPRTPIISIICTKTTFYHYLTYIEHIIITLTDAAFCLIVWLISLLLVLLFGSCKNLFWGFLPWPCPSLLSLSKAYVLNHADNTVCVSGPIFSTLHSVLPVFYSKTAVYQIK